MRISDWSSDVCSSDLPEPFRRTETCPDEVERDPHRVIAETRGPSLGGANFAARRDLQPVGRKPPMAEASILDEFEPAAPQPLPQRRGIDPDHRLYGGKDIIGQVERDGRTEEHNSEFQ